MSAKLPPLSPKHLPPVEPPEKEAFRILTSRFAPRDAEGLYALFQKLAPHDNLIRLLPNRLHVSLAVTDAERASLLHRATRDGLGSLVTLFKQRIEQSPDRLGDLPLHMIAANGSPQLLKALIDPRLLERRNRSDLTPLLSTVFRAPSDPAVQLLKMNMLLMAGANGRARTQDGFTFYDLLLLRQLDATPPLRYILSLTPPTSFFLDTARLAATWGITSLTLDIDGARLPLLPHPVATLLHLHGAFRSFFQSRSFTILREVWHLDLDPLWFSFVIKLSLALALGHEAVTSKAAALSNAGVPLIFPLRSSISIQWKGRLFDYPLAKAMHALPHLLFHIATQSRAKAFSLSVAMEGHDRTKTLTTYVTRYVSHRPQNPAQREVVELVLSRVKEREMAGNL